MDMNFFDVSNVDRKLHLIKQDFIRQIRMNPLLITAFGYCKIDRQIFSAVNCYSASHLFTFFKKAITFPFFADCASVFYVYIRDSTDPATFY